jgi:hypothetical protein
MGPGRLGAEPLGVVAGGDQQGRRGVDADAVQGNQPGGGRHDHSSAMSSSSWAFSSSRARTRRPRVRRAVLVAKVTGSTLGRGRSAAAWAAS